MKTVLVLALYAFATNAGGSPEIKTLKLPQPDMQSCELQKAQAFKDFRATHSGIGFVAVLGSCMTEQ